MKQTASARRWRAKWIGTGDCHASWRTPSRPAPYFRTTFDWKSGAAARAYICGLGYYVLYLNGRRVGDHVLDPVVTRYDVRARYVEYDVTDYLVPGENTVGIVLGNGWYNCLTAEVWHFDKAPWQDEPKLIFELISRGKMLTASGSHWRCFRDGPIRFDALRNGEHYDAAREIPGWNVNGFDDRAWHAAVVVPGPGGVLTRQKQPPCRVMQTIPAHVCGKTAAGADIYDVGVNMTGWCRIAVRGDAGSSLQIVYSELLNAAGTDIDQRNISCYIESGDTQTDCYRLKGGGVEIWEPEFTYHGFRYIRIAVTGRARIDAPTRCQSSRRRRIAVTGRARIDAVEGRLVSSSFAAIAEWESSSATMNRLWEMTRRSYVSNFTGIPTDCPHREKNGWSGDAFLAAETGLFLFDSAASYAGWLEDFRDLQRPNGQLPGIVPTGGWGYNWGSGPAWDGAFVMIPWYIYVYTGEASVLRDCYRGVVRYLHYLATLAEGHIVRFGLGDWCHCDPARMTDAALTSTGYYYQFARTAAKYAAVLGKTTDRAMWLNLASAIGDAFQRRFYRGGGVYGNGEITALACALFHGLVPASETEAVFELLAAKVEAGACKADFGILGAKYVPRVLAEGGRADLALRVIAQQEFPGWGYWVKRGATTLHESWASDSSQNHIMFGDIAAWMMAYPAGLVPDESNPGFRSLTIRPAWRCGLSWVRARRRFHAGEVGIAWRKTEHGFACDVDLPPGQPGTLILPDGSVRALAAGRNEVVFGGD